MYSTCIFCNSGLGANETVEHFPVGRRLAFDAEKGRLWVVCRKCGRWNLSPLEERWEAIEECERLYHDTPTRVATENVGLARLGEGTDLVRIGRPLRPEFAAWRYGDQFGRRARKMWLRGIAAGTGGAAVAGAALVSTPVLILLVGSALALMMLHREEFGTSTLAGASRARLALLRDDGEPLLDGPDEGITGACIQPAPRRGAPWWLEVRTSRWDRHRGFYQLGDRKHALTGGAAVTAVSVLLADANAWGGSRREVQGAVERIERMGDPHRYFKEAEKEARKAGRGYRDLWSLPTEVRLAMEMASHEDAERRALEGEMAELERRWRAAEEIAAISDRLAVPPEVERKLERLRTRGGSGGR